MIPMNQTVKIRKAGSIDTWGVEVPGQARSYPCRIDQTSELTRDQNGREVVSKAVIILKGAVVVAHTDTIEYKDEAGNSYFFSPVSIAVIRDFAGKPILTKVVV